LISFLHEAASSCAFTSRGLLPTTSRANHGRRDQVSLTSRRTVLLASTARGSKQPGLAPPGAPVLLPAPANAGHKRSTRIRRMGVSPSGLRAAGSGESRQSWIGSSYKRSKRRTRGASALLATIGALATLRLDLGEASRGTAGGSGMRPAGPGGTRSRGALVFSRQGHRTLPREEARRRAGSGRVRRSRACLLLVQSTAAATTATAASAAAAAAASALRGTHSNRGQDRIGSSSAGGGGRRNGSRRPISRRARAPLLCSAVERDTTASPIGISPPAPGRDAKRNHSNGRGDDEVEARRPEWSAQLALPPWGSDGQGGAPTAARRNRRDLEVSWLEDPGRDLPFEFADLHEAMTLPCSIQLFPRVERRSLVYVDGREAPSHRARKYTAATIDRRPVDRAASSGSRGGGGGGGGNGQQQAAAAFQGRRRRGESGASRDRQDRAARAGDRSRSSSGSTGGSGVGDGQESKSMAAAGAATAARGIIGAGVGDEGWEREGRRSGDTIRLVGEMDIDKPAYLQVQEGVNGEPDALLVSQFGFTRGGAVSRVSLDPTPRLPPRLLAEAAVVDNGNSADRTRPRLTGTWTGPLLWPNEVNQLPTEALVRLTQGRAAEIRYKAGRNIAVDAARGADSLQSPTDRNGTTTTNEGATASPDVGDGKAALRFESQQFSLLRRESDRFNDGDMPRRPHESASQAAAAASPSLRPPEPPPPPPPQLPRSAPPPRPAPAAAAAADENTADSSSQEPEREMEHEAKSAPPPPPPRPSESDSESSSSVLPGWDGPTPEEAAGFLIADGFLIPGKADGGVYLVVPTAAEEKGFPVAGGGGGGSRLEGDRDRAGAGGGTAAGAAERIVRLTSPKRGWFYHKAVWVVLPGGKKVVLTARVHKPIFGQAQGELVILEMPRVDHPLSEPNLPWRERVLVRGPDVMFEVVDLDPEDSTVQVVCAEFFGGRVTMHSLSGGAQPAVTESWVLDENAGPAYSITAVDLRGGSPGGRPTHFLVTTHESSYNSYSFFAGAGGFNAKPAFEVGSSSASSVGGRLNGTAADSSARRHSSATGFDSAGGGKVGSGVVTGGPKERRWQRREEGGTSGAGGALLAYEIPEDWRSLPRFYPAPGWLRATLASGFRVRGLSINPGTPGFPYVFHPHRSMEV
ncbi:unnamed protein product, partial [Scytosiphon promiscuus]